MANNYDLDFYSQWTILNQIEMQIDSLREYIVKLHIHWKINYTETQISQLFINIRHDIFKNLLPNHEITIDLKLNILENKIYYLPKLEYATI